jgi:cation diffusion facilitator family transporter
MTTADIKAGQTPSAARICGSGGFLGEQHDRNERATWLVVGVTTVMMVGEIVGGSLYNSMALLADGWHMSTHAAALTVAALAYRYARVHATDPRFAFGTGKVGELAGFASAVVLGVIAILIAWESFGRLLNPHPIHFSQATAIAVIGLVVNLVSAWLLHQGGHDHHDHDHDHDHDHEHDHDAAHGLQAAGHHHDNNLRAAYQHVLADALTSVLAIAGLLAGRYLGWVWMDPLIGILGGVVIARWSLSLIKVAGGSLLDMSGSGKLADAVRTRLETTTDTVCDLHLWRLGPGHQALIVSIISAAPATPDAYKAKLAGLPGLSHVTVEVNPPGGSYA